MTDSPTVARFVRLATQQVKLHGQVSAALALEMIAHCRSLEAAGDAITAENRRLHAEVVDVRSRPDWRVGMAVTPKLKTHMNYGQIGVVRHVRAATENSVERITVELRFYGRRGNVEEPSENWMTA